MRMVIGMNNKKIDIERLVVRVALISNLIIWVIVILNLWLWHNKIVSAYVTGWNLCSIAMTISVSIAGDINFKYDMEQYELEWEKIKKEIEDGEREIIGACEDEK